MKVVSLPGWMLLFSCSLPAIFAQEMDIKHAKSLISMIQQPNSPERDKVDEILSQIPPQSPCRSVATQAASIVHIQQSQFSKAWKCLKSNPTKSSSTPHLQLGQHQLKLWLLLEAESTQDAEEIFEKIVGLASSDTLESSQRVALIEDLGGLIGMLEADEQQKAIPEATIQNAKSALETLAGKSDDSRFRTEWEKSNQHGKAILARVDEFRSLSLDEAKAVVSSLETELADAKTNVESFKERMEQETKAIDEVEMIRKQLFATKKVLNNEWDKETEGKPRPPVAPKIPVEPKTTYRRDKDTGKRVVVDEPSETEMREYRRRMENYRSEQRQYEDEVRSFPTRMADWQQKDLQRRTSLKAEMQQVNAAISLKDKEIKEAKNQMRLGTVAELKEAVSQQNELSEKLLVSQFALADVSDSAKKTKSSIRPSRFALIDYAREESRLSKLLRNQDDLRR
jgi:hypothetical protein